MGKLTNIGIKNAGPGRYQDGQGLFLQRSETGGKWTYRYSFAGKRRDMGLGTWPAVSLAQARRERDEWAAVLRKGQDPISERNAQKQDAAAALDRRDPTFEEMAELTLESRAARLRDGGKRGQWINPLRNYMFPKIGKRRMSTLAPKDISDALKPVWKKKHPTALKALRRTRLVFKLANLSGVDCEISTVDKAEHMLGEYIHTPKHFDALPWQELPKLYQDIPDTSSGLCLRWIILTAVRGGAARGARFTEIDGDIWTVPKTRIKGFEGSVEDFDVPLSNAALALVEHTAQFSDTYLFPGWSHGHVTDVAVTKALRRLHPSATVHGFRSTFSTWAQETRACPWDVREAVLGHKVGNTVERSYARSDLLDQRRIAMEKWAEFVTGEASKVVTLRK